MKKIYYILIAIMFVTTSCELTDVLDNNPPNNLVPENVVKNQADLEALLNGVYSTIISRTTSYYYHEFETMPSALVGTMKQSGFGAANNDIRDNSVDFQNTVIRNYWNIVYEVVNLSNNVIDQAENLSEEEISESKRVEIIGEAKFLRAMATFDILRYFGQYWDESSNYGIVIRTEPSNFVTRSKARSTVAESYNQIYLDLEDAITDAPDFSVSYRASKTAAKALKARVLLYNGKFSEAAILAGQVIDEGTRTLETTFESTFTDGLNSTEMILMTYRDANSDVDQNNRKRYYSGRAASSGWFKTLISGDPRESFTYSGSVIKKVNQASTYRPTYYLRLAEMYLIKAEGLANSGETLLNSKKPLDIIRNRAGTGNSPATTMAELKEDIFEEYAKELAYENGSVWAAAIRFGKIMTLKPSVTSSNQYILPIPEEEIIGNGEINLENQNPGYE
ncbi:RagB/SusD family nutrient uptake outer membrane protein [Polaribacter sp. MSW13]|uniref:RagB/SusD family nutrient uptake outer membrane protein n=1 Tax=Polaribacter marinus TaxID=2916838 RepID=A0A9X1VKG3_9FLAO|nr:RagB/SusD family nutrient uptake outer membrane protein [Polaribacter marinus]MCI2227628.1 RagB/SusD family nutrient uptake outer membrane protein [Polaribacter marinus]